MADLTESIVVETIDCFQLFPLKDLDLQWVNDLWLNRFINLEDYPNGFDFSESLVETILKAINIAEKWTQKRCDNVECDVLWKVFKDHDIDIKFLLAFIYGICRYSIKRDAQFYEKIMGIKCAKLYFTLLRIPGSSVYFVYHPILFQQAFDCLKIPNVRVFLNTQLPASAYQNDGRIQINSSDEVGDLGERLFSQDQCNTILIEFIDILKSVILLFKTFRLRNFDLIIERIVEKLSECVAVENHLTDFNFSRDVDEICSLQCQYGISYVITALGYCAYLSLCQPLHGDMQEIYPLCLKSLSGHILLLETEFEPSDVITHEHIVIKDNALAFICYNLDKRLDISSKASRILAQNLCIQCYDKTNYQLEVASGILSILKRLSLKDYVKIVKWFVKFITQYPQNKLITLEIFSLIIAEPEREVTSEITQEWEVYAKHIPIIFSIIQLCNDKEATVRAKALAVLTSALKQTIDVINKSSKDLASRDNEKNYQIEYEIPYKREDNTANEKFVAKKNASHNRNEGEADNPETVQKLVEKQVNKHESCLVNAKFQLFTFEELVDLLILRSMDFKAHVRKVALEAIESLLCLDEAFVNEKCLTILAQATQDLNVTVRRSSISSLTVILHKYYQMKFVQKICFKNIFDVLLEPKNCVHFKAAWYGALEAVEPFFLLYYGNSSTLKYCTWTILSEIACGDSKDSVGLVEEAYSFWNTEGKLKHNLSHILETELGFGHDPAVWMLLSTLSSYIEIKNLKTIISRWEHLEEEVNISTRLSMLKFLGNSTQFMTNDQLKHFQAIFEKDISSFQCQCPLISVTIGTLFQIYIAQSKVENAAQKLMKNFADQMMQSMICILSKFVLQNNSPDDVICRVVQTLGDFALLATLSISRNTLSLLQSIIELTSDSANSIAIESSGLTAIGRPSSKLHALSFSSLGKLCLINTEYLESSLSIFVEELTASENVLVRVNIVRLFGDLCRRYRSVAYLFVPFISVCLKDIDGGVRREALTEIITLLIDDYIEFKKSLFYYLLSVLADPDKDMHNKVEYYLSYIFVKDNPNFFEEHFVETICYFNSCSAVPSLAATLEESNLELLSLEGENNFEKRKMIYNFLMMHTPILRRFNIVLKLSKEILDAAATQTLSLDDNVEAVIKDCLVVLSSHMIGPFDEIQRYTEDDNDESKSTDSINSKARYIQEVICIIIPSILSLKKKLLDAKSPFLSSILEFIGKICKEYTNEIKDAFICRKEIINKLGELSKYYGSLC